MSTPPPIPPGRAVAAASRDVLERILLALTRLPRRVDRSPIVAALGQTLAQLAMFEKSGIDDEDHLELLRAAANAAERTKTLVAAAVGTTDSEGLIPSLTGVGDALSGALAATLDQIVLRQDLLYRRRPVPAPEKPKLWPFEASVGTPRLFVWERAPLDPLVRVAPPPSLGEEDEEPAPGSDAATGDMEDDAPSPAHLPELADFDERSSLGHGAEGREAGPEPHGALEREVEQDSSAAEGLSVEERESLALKRLVQDTGEELGQLGLLRAPTGPDTAWAVGPLAFEERLLRALDALMSLGEPFVSAATAQDPSSPAETKHDVLEALLAWAGDSLVPDPARAFARTFVLGCVSGEDTARAAVTAFRQSHPMTYEAQRDALALAPHPGISQEIERLIQEETPALVGLGLSVLERRGQVPFEVAAPLLSHPNAAVRASASRALAAAVPREAAVSLLAEHRKTEEDEVALAATAVALGVLGAREGLQIAREKLGEEAAYPGSLPKPAKRDLLRLLALGGGPADAPLLLSLLGRDPLCATLLGFFGDPTLLFPLTTALSEAALQTAHVGFARALAASLHRVTGLGRAPQDDPNMPDPLVPPRVDPAYWRSALEEKKDTFAVRRKLRFGAPYSPLMTIREAEIPELSIQGRAHVLLELRLASAGQSRVHADDWVSRQKLLLAELRSRFSGGAEGQW